MPKSGGELDHKITRAGIAVGLKYHVDFAEAALAGGSQCGANLRGMMAVVINHADAGYLSAQLKTAVHATKIFQGGADVIGLDVEGDSDRDGRGSVESVMHARHVQAE